MNHELSGEFVHGNMETRDMSDGNFDFSKYTVAHENFRNC